MQAWIDIVEKNICYKSLKNSMKIFRIINIFRYFVTMMGIMYIEIDKKLSIRPKESPDPIIN